MHENAFVNKPGRPTEAELARALGPAKPLWDRMIAAAMDMDVQDESGSRTRPSTAGPCD
jgi:hypothetical protein